MSRARLTVWIAEEEDPDEWLLLTGRFRGHLDDGQGVVEEFDNLTATDAVAWGRARSSVVLIRAGGSDYYSAGRRNPDPKEYRPWPMGLELRRRRVPGCEALDNRETDAGVLWDVRVSSESSDHIDPAPFQAAIRSHPATERVSAPAPGYPTVSAAFLVKASTLPLARRIADEVADPAFAALGAELTSACSVEVYPHRPSKPVTGPGFAY